MSMQDASGPQQFEFTGNAKEWFGIWIVNLLLSIVTIGIYSAWAKVRTKKYFYNHTYVGGRNFDYHATGKQILIGRIIVVVVVILAQILSTVFAPFAIVFLLALLVGFPWLIVKAMMFNARMSSFSNVRFNFQGSKMRAWVVYLGYPIGIYLVLVAFGAGAAFLMQSEQFVLGGALILLALIVLVAAFPFIDRALKDYNISNHLLGTSEFDMHAPLGPFVKAMLFALGWVVLVFLALSIVMGVAFWGMVDQFQNLIDGGKPTPAQIGLFSFLYLVFIFAFLPAAFIYQAMVRNVVYNSSTLGGKHRFVSDVKARSLLWIAVSNVVVVVCTLGLMLPWAQVRLAKYLAAHTTAVIEGSLNEFVGDEQAATTALGDAYSDLEGIDVGLPI